MTAQARRLWREKLDYLLAQEAIKAGSAERFELQEQIAECRAKLAELDEEDQRRRDATAAAPRASRAPLAPTLRVGVTPGTLRVPTSPPAASPAGPASGSAGILPARRRQAANGSGTPPPLQTPTTSAEGAARPGRQDAGAPRAGAPSGGAPRAGAPGVGAHGTDAPPRIDLTHLPAGAPHFLGREAELAALDAALHSARPDAATAASRTAIVELVAPGGTGKTALIKRWLEGLQRRGWGGTRRVYAWSFYSQGTTDDRQASEDHFLAAALAWFAVAIAPSANPADKGQALAEALTQAPTLLLLDGCEPLQHPPGPLAGELRAPGLKALFAHLASAGRPGLCVLSTRERVRNLDEWVRGDAHPGGPVLRLDLANLSDTDGARLLHTLGAARAGAAPIAADDPELRAASRAVQGHALTLSLLGNYLRLAHGGDIRRRDRVDLGAASAATGGHAFRVMAAYTHWLGQGGAPGAQALAALRLLGLFDRPASPDNLAALRAAPPIPGLTEALFAPPSPGATVAAATESAATGSAATGSAATRSAGVPPARFTGVPPATARVSVRVLGLARTFWQSLVHRTPPVGGGPAGSRRSQVAIGDTQWRIALKRLEDAGLIAPPAAANPAPADSLDAHPLVREYLADTLATNHPAAWREGHRRLYERLKGAAPHRPEGLDGLQPLYQAVAHGCRAGLWQEVKDEVYEDRILRGTGNDGFYSVKKLGAFGADLGAVACLFAEPWSRPAPALKESDRAWVLNQAAFSLRALGRLGEALEPMRAGAEMYVKQEAWVNAAIVYGNLSELQLTLGRPAEAVADGRRSVEYADRSGDAALRMMMRTTLADALHQRGETAQANEGFAEAESMQAQWQPEYPLLYSLRGFLYCDLLLAAAERAAWSAHWAAYRESAPAGPADACEAVAERARGAQRAWREVFTNPESLLDIALDHLTLARCALYADRLADRPPGREAQDQAGHALDGLRAAGRQDILPLGLLTRAWLRHAQCDPAGAAADLAEAERIASRGAMPLYLADCALHRARLFHDRAALTQARRLIETHGYGRRLPELADAESAAAAW